ncbi:MAG TPA: c-type cytochrome [Anaerolineales bacterium]|jgi:mono/diheme cytochrome c family protein|nr:c-type cytochrome [Anaerolineales bacterium]
MFDIPGVVILVAVIAAFGFLATRAWKLKRAYLKWPGVFISGLLTLIPTALLVLALIGFYKLNESYGNPIAVIQVAGTPEQIARGEKLANICVSCHTPDDVLPLSGSNFAAKFDFPPLGTLYAPNLTPSGNIGSWTDGEVMRAIREGVHKNGRSLLIMPAGGFRNMSDDDVQALVAYLRSQPSTGEPTPENRFNVLGAIFMNLSDFRTAQQPAGSVTTSQAGTPEYGKYMVDIIGCRDCHGPELQGKVDSGQPGPPAGPNLTKIVPQWTEEQFMTFFNTGTMPDGRKVPILTLASGFSEPRMPWPMVRAATTDDELKAMYEYLHSLPVMDNPAR